MTHTPRNRHRIARGAKPVLVVRSSMSVMLRRVLPLTPVRLSSPKSDPSPARGERRRVRNKRDIER